MIITAIMTITSWL